MLIELFGHNFGCFRDEFSLSMLATDIDPSSTRGIVEAKIFGEVEPLRLLRSVAIYGPNGSGKSTVLRAARALRHLIEETKRLRSDAPLASYEPFALGCASKEPVLLGLKAVIDGHIFEYSVEFDRTSFQHERLVEIESSGERVLFDRIGQNVTGAWRSDETFALLVKDFRPNALLLSLADWLTPKLAANIAVGLRQLLLGFDSIVPSVFIKAARAAGVARRVHEDEKFAAWLRSRLCAADIGVVDLRTQKVQGEAAGRIDDPESNTQTEEEFSSTYRLSLVHRGESGPIELDYSQESLGTRRLVELAPLMYGIAHATTPRAVFVDELDASLHPVLLQGLIRHFNCELPLERARGQLIFATHETTLLDDEAKEAVLRRDQVYLTEKDATGAARLFSVAEFRERNNLNIRHRYLQGRYGALPALGSFWE